MAGGDESIAIVEDRWHGALLEGLRSRNAGLPVRAGCVQAFNVMRGCPLDFSIYVTGRPQLDPGCKVPERFSCQGRAPPAAAAAKADRCR
jgi:hypothetical protein